MAIMFDLARCTRSVQITPTQRVMRQRTGHLVSASSVARHRDQSSKPLAIGPSVLCVLANLDCRRQRKITSTSSATISVSFRCRINALQVNSPSLHHTSSMALANLFTLQATTKVVKDKLHHQQWFAPQY